ncbi:MAG TPA: MlaD family protein [Candidatus Acidoferrum sp.]|jgi:phospholipid/cholesterol/gamma-HCH transport system substrate-binding protein
MPQRKQLTWTELRVGLFVLVALALIAVGIFYVTGAGFFGPKYRLLTYLPEVAGITNGAPVRLDGVDIGNVESIKIVPRTPGHIPEKNRNIEVMMRVDKRFQPDILSDSTATLVTEGLLGNRYVNITRGFTGVQLKDNQEVPGSAEQNLADVMASMQTVTTDIHGLIQNLQTGKGTLGKLFTDDQAYNNLNGLLAKGNDVVADIQKGRGTLGKLVTSDEMYGKANQALDNVNGVVADARSGKGTIGRLLNDPTLYDEAKKAIANGNSMLADVRSGKGSLGKLVTDDELYNKLRDTSANLNAATAKLNDNTTTAGKLFSDPKLYDNLTGLTGDLRLLIGDFRQNPKKFLRIKVAVF